MRREGDAAMPNTLYRRAPLGVLARLRSGENTSGDSFSKDDSLPTPVYGANGVIGSTSLEPNIQRESILIGRVGACGEINVAPPSSFASDNVLVVDLNEQAHRGWMYYVLLSSKLKDLNTSTAQPLITASKIRQVRVPFPSMMDQQRIADYLDRETAEIDAAVADLDKYVELLGARKSLLISETIGSDKVKMAPLKFDAQLVTSGSRGWAKYYSEEGCRFIRIADLQRGGYGFRDDNPQYVNISDEREGTRTLTKVGDLVFSITAYLGSIGVITAEQAGAFVSQHVALVRLRGNLWIPQFVAYSALGRSGQRYLTEHSYGGTKSQLNLDQVQDFPVPLISRTKQREIVERLDHETAEIDSLITESTKLRELLLKRRSVLITEVVTGRKEV